MTVRAEGEELRGEEQIKTAHVRLAGIEAIFLELVQRHDLMDASPRLAFVRFGAKSIPQR
jgi:hypothetical protein